MELTKKRVVLSALSVVLVLCLLAGGTMAWFTDTEKVNSNFTAGVLDIVVNPDEDGYTTTEALEFKNLRPMLYDNFEKELVASGNINNLENNDQNPDDYPSDNLPIYFRPVTIVNKGTLPTYVHLTMSPRVVDDKEPVLYGGDIHNIDQKAYESVTCDNTLKGALKIYVYRQNENGTWERVDDVNLNEKTLADTEAAEYNPNSIIKAGEEVTYIMAGYLPSETDNTYQGKHYHGTLTVQTRQADQGAYTPSHPGSGSDEGGTIEVKAYVKLTNHAAGGAVVAEHMEVTLMLDKNIKTATSADFADQLRAFVESYTAPDGKKYRYTGVIPDTFKVKYDADTDSYYADFGEDQMIIGVSEIK